MWYNLTKLLIVGNIFREIFILCLKRTLLPSDWIIEHKLNQHIILEIFSPSFHHPPLLLCLKLMYIYF